MESSIDSRGLSATPQRAFGEEPPRGDNSGDPPSCTCGGCSDRSKSTDVGVVLGASLGRGLKKGVERYTERAILLSECLGVAVMLFLGVSLLVAM